MGERANDDATAEPSHPRLVAIRPGALGDALLTFPVLSWLRHHVPSVRIALVARRDVLLLAQSSGVADDVSPYEDPAWSVLFADEPASRGLAYQICSGARVVAWFGADDGVVRRNLLALGASAVVVAPGKPVQSCQRHMALQLGEGLAQLGEPEGLAGQRAHVERRRLASRRERGQTQDQRQSGKATAHAASRGRVVRNSIFFS